MKKFLALAVILAASTSPALADDAAQAIVDQAIKAHGGKDKLAKTQYMVRTVKGKIDAVGKSVDFTGTAMFHLPEQARWTLELEGPQKWLMTLAINGDKGWRLGGGEAKEMSKQEWQEQHERAYVNWLTTLLPLQEKDITLSVLADAKVGDEAAAGILVKRKGYLDVKLYFSKKTNLLLKSERRGKEAGILLTMEYLYGSCKEFDGVLMPTTRQELANGKKIVEWTASDYKFPQKVPDGAFSKP